VRAREWKPPPPKCAKVNKIDAEIVVSCILHVKMLSAKP